MTEPVATGGAPAAPSGNVPGELAEYGPRIIAYLIDFAIMMGLMIVIMILSFVLGKITPLLSLVVLPLYFVPIVYLVYLVGMDNAFTSRGQTYGKKIMNIKIIKEDGSDIDLVGAIIRVLGYGLSGFLYLGYIWILIDDNNQGWHDKIAKTYVIKC